MIRKRKKSKMPPNVVDPAVLSQENEDLETKTSTEQATPTERAEPHNVGTAKIRQLRRGAPPPNRSSNEYKLKFFLSSLNLMTHILIGAVTGISLIFGFRNGVPLGATPLHIVLCVIGYQLLMAEAILSLSTDNGWSSHLKLVDKRRAHYILQILGSGLAVAGSFIKILDKKEERLPTVHGKFAFIALVFTSVSLVNGVASLWAFELRRYLSANISKLTHICFGTVGFFAACIALCYGFEKMMFRKWMGDAIAYTAISFTATFAFIVIVTPLATFYLKTKTLVGKR